MEETSTTAAVAAENTEVELPIETLDDNKETSQQSLKPLNVCFK